MKYIKTLIAVTLFFATFFITGESVLLYIDSFQNEYISTTFYVDAKDNATPQGMIADIASITAKHNIYPFAVASTNTSALNKELTIYADDEAKAYIIKNSQLNETTYDSLLFGSTNIQFMPFRSFAKDISFSRLNEYNFIGNIDDARNAKVELMEYAGGFPQEGRPNSIYSTQLSLWVLCALILVFLTVYDVFLSRRENHVKIINGYSIKRIAAQGIFTDIIIYSAAFIISLFLTTRLTHAQFNIISALICFACLIVINSLFYIISLTIMLRAYMPSASVPQKLLSGNYILNLASLLITAAILSGNMVVIGEVLAFSRQKPYFEDHKENEYLSFMGSHDEPVLGYTSFYNIAIINEIFYREQFNTLKPGGFVTSGILNSDNALLANYNDRELLLKYFPTLSLDGELDDIYFIIPEKKCEDTALPARLQYLTEAFWDKGYTYEPTIIYYDYPVELVYTNENLEMGSGIAKNPTVIFNARNMNGVPIPPDERDVTFGARFDYHFDLMYIPNDAAVKDIEQAYPGVLVGRTNVYERYLNQWEKLKVILYVNVILSALTLAFQIIITNTIIRLEYAVNAKEHAIKTVNGHSLWQTNRKIYAFNMLPLSLSILIITGLYFATQNAMFIGMVSGCVFLLILEAVIITLQIFKHSNSALAKTFKGGMDI
ncbi:MAG: hypothetical protein RR764_04330 [Oscillospiraceae bacterium]